MKEEDLLARVDQWIIHGFKGLIGILKIRLQSGNLPPIRKQELDRLIGNIRELQELGSNFQSKIGETDHVPSDY